MGSFCIYDRKLSYMVKARNCPVCGAEILDEYPNEICTNCKWKQDCYQEYFPDEEDQANKMSLN